MADPNRSFTIGELVLDTSINLPIIVEVKADCNDGQHKFKKGDLLWLVQLVEEDEKNITVEGSRWDAPDFIFSLNTSSRLNISQKAFCSLQEHISFGPVIDISGLANLSKPAEPAFGITKEVKGIGGLSAILGETGMVVAHGKVQITGFLSKGVKNPLMIPGDYKGLFTKTETNGTKTLDKPGPLANLVRKLPMEVIYTDAPSTDRRGSLKSPDEHTLENESPITILAMCRYTATHFSLHNNDSRQPPFQATWLYPDYCKLPLRPASPIPLPSWAIDNVSRPQQTVHILTDEQFNEMNDRLRHSPPPVPARSPPPNFPTGKPFKSSPLEKRHVYEVVPLDARPISLMPFSNGRQASESPFFDVPQRRSVKRDQRAGGRRTESDLRLNELSHRNYMNLGMRSPQQGIESDGYMQMNPITPTNGAPVLPPRRHKPSPSKSSDSNLDEKAGNSWKPVPAPRPDGKNKASTFPRQLSDQPSQPLRPIVQRHATDSIIHPSDVGRLDYGPPRLSGKSTGQSDVDYGGLYAEAYEHQPSHTWREDTDERGYLKPRKDV